MSKLEVKILHQNYVLTCPDGQEAMLHEAIERVEQQFERLRESSRLRSREHIGILLGVKLAFENLELREQLRTLQQQLAQLQDSDDSSPAALQLQQLQAQAEHDQQLAQQLLLRLDQALASDAAETAQEAVSLTPGHGDSAHSMELPAAAAGNR